MSYIYHAVPENFIGNILVPLNEMHNLDDSLKAKYLEKYKGREEILKRRVPRLDCLWNDVVQFLPVHHRKVFELQVELGIISEVPAYKFFEIDVDLLELDMAVVFFKNKPKDDNSEVKSLESVDLSTLDTIPEPTIAYFKSTIGSGELPFNYQFIPHILYKGSVDVSEQNIITL